MNNVHSWWLNEYLRTWNGIVYNDMLRHVLPVQEEFNKLLAGGQTSSAVSESSRSTVLGGPAPETNTSAPTSAPKKDSVVEWSQQEQKDFELALMKYPKGTDERLSIIRFWYGTV